MHGRTVAGLACLLVGVLLLSGVVQLSIAPELHCTVSPDGTQDAPTILTVGEPVELSVSTTSTALPHPRYWSVTVSISWIGENQGGTTLDLGEYDSTDTIFVYEPGPTGSLTRIYYTFTEWKETWTPRYSGTEYIFRWTIEVKDRSGSAVKTHTETTYCMTLDDEADEPTPVPDGVFKVNDIEVPSDTHIITLTGTCNVVFTPTENENYIDHVRVEVEHESTGQQFEKDIYRSSLDTYAGFIEVPEDLFGQYEIRCYIIPVGNDPIYKGSVILDYQEWTPPEPEPDPNPPDPTPENPPDPTPEPGLPAPDGYLEINGHTISAGMTISSGPEVTFRFVPTAGQDNITSVYCRMINDTGGSAKVELALQDDGSYGIVCVAPEIGEYALRLFVDPVEGDEVQLIDANLVILEEEPSHGLRLSQIAGIVIAGIGIVIMVTGRRRS